MLNPLSFYPLAIILSDNPASKSTRNLGKLSHFVSTDGSMQGLFAVSSDAMCISKNLDSLK